MPVLTLGDFRSPFHNGDGRGSERRWKTKRQHRDLAPDVTDNRTLNTGTGTDTDLPDRARVRDQPVAVPDGAQRDLRRAGLFHGDQNLRWGDNPGTDHAAAAARRRPRQRGRFNDRVLRPEQPRGGERGNWIQADPDKGWSVIMRSVLEAIFDKSWRAGEIERFAWPYRPRWPATASVAFSGRGSSRQLHRCVGGQELDLTPRPVAEHSCSREKSLVFEREVLVTPCSPLTLHDSHSDPLRTRFNVNFPHVRVPGIRLFGPSAAGARKTVVYSWTYWPEAP